MMGGLVVHDVTRGQLEAFASKPTHALLLVGPSGMGKSTIARHLAAELLQLDLDQLASYPYKMFIEPSGGSISIEVIRQLRSFLRLKTTGDGELRRVIVVEQADGLTQEAQNAFLKLLEEPPSDTVLILTTANPRALLPTILSRAQTLILKTPPEKLLRAAFAAGVKDDRLADRLYLLSAGLPGLYSALASEEQSHPLLASVTQAKDLLGKQAFERLIVADSLSKDKVACLALVEALERTARAGLEGAGVKQDLTLLARWHRIRKGAHEARRALLNNANAKLTLTNLILQL